MEFGNRTDHEVLRMVPEDRRRDVDKEIGMFVEHLSGEATLHAYDKLHGLVPIRAAVEQYKILEQRGFRPLLLFYRKPEKVWGLALGSPVSTGGFEELDKLLAQIHPGLRSRIETHMTDGVLK